MTLSSTAKDGIEAIRSTTRFPAASALTKVATSALIVVAAAVPPATAQALAASDPHRPFEISDNSFLVEEALNQESGVFQNILNLRIDSRDQWVTTFTQEWPLFSHSHQISFTVPYAAAAGGASGFGDVFIHYRFQAIDGGALPAFSPRVSLIVPSGSQSRGLGYGTPGWQVNLPFSKQAGDLYFHWNVGFTDFPRAEVDGTEYNLLTPQVAASGIWRARPMINLMLEGVLEWPAQVESSAVQRSTSVTIVPGVRTGWNVGETQTVVGFGLPLRFTENGDGVGAFLYVSYELPFAHR